MTEREVARGATPGHGPSWYVLVVDYDGTPKGELVGPLDPETTAIRDLIERVRDWPYTMAVEFNLANAMTPAEFLPDDDDDD